MGRHTLSFGEAMAEPLTPRNAEIVDLSMNPIKKARQIEQLARLTRTKRSPISVFSTRQGLVRLAEQSEIAGNLVEYVTRLGEADVSASLDQSEPTQESDL